MSPPRSSRYTACAFVAGTALFTVLGLGACSSNEGDPNPVAFDSGVDASASESASASDSGALEGGGVDSGSGGDAANDAAASCDYRTKCPFTRGVGPVAGISGDTTPAGGDSVSATGSTSEWLSVRVTENDNSVIGRAQSLTAKLTSAPGDVFEMYLYVNDGTALAECTTVAGQSTDLSGAQTAQITWGESSVANHKDDSATVTIRVQHVSGPCAVGAWTLDLTGNTAP